MARYKQGDILVYDGKNINIKMQIGLKKGEKVEFIRQSNQGMILKRSNGYEFGVYSDLKKHFKRV